MATLLRRNLPDDLHQRLRQRADQNRRSVTSETLALLESARIAKDYTDTGLPQPFVGRFPLTDELLIEARQTGRA